MPQTNVRWQTCAGLPELQTELDQQMTDTEESKIEQAISLIYEYGGIDGAHHKQWLLDQVLRVLLGDEYAEWIEGYCEGDEYEWDTGIAP